MNIQASVLAAWAKIQGMNNGLILLLPNIMLALIIFAVFFSTLAKLTRVVESQD